MKKKLLFLIILVMLFIPSVKAKNQVKLYLFYSKTCPHCAREKEYLSKIEKKYDNLEIIKYEISEGNNNDLFMLVDESLNDGNKYIPYTIIGTYSLVGFNEYTEDKIVEYIDTCSKYECMDLVGKVKKDNKSFPTLVKEAKEKLENDINNSTKKEKKEKNNSMMKIPLVGKVDVKKFSLPLIAVSIGLVDGFNPCAMWVLIF